MRVNLVVKNNVLLGKTDCTFNSAHLRIVLGTPNEARFLQKTA